MTKIRLAIVTSRPVYYYIPLYRLLANHPEIDLTVVYTTGVGRATHNPADFNHYQSAQQELEGYRSIHLPGANRVDRLSGPASLNWQVVPHIVRAKYDVVWIHGYSVGSNMLGALAQRLVVRRAVWLRDDQHLRNPRSRWKQRAKKLVLPRLFGSWSGLYVGTLNREWLAYFGIPDDRLYFVPHAVEIDSPEPALPAPAPFPRKRLTILSVGRMVWEKNYQTLLEAVVRLRTTHLVRLVLVGDGPELDALRAMAGELGLTEDDVEFAGRVDQCEIPSYYTEADLFVLSSISETWGLVVNEAMAFGLPVVVSNRVGCSEDLVHDGENGFVFEAGNVDDLVRALEATMVALGNGVPLGLASRELISTWSNQTALAGVLDALADARRTGRSRGT